MYQSTSVSMQIGLLQKRCYYDIIIIIIYKLGTDVKGLCNQETKGNCKKFHKKM